MKTNQARILLAMALALPLAEFNRLGSTNSQAGKTTNFDQVGMSATRSPIETQNASQPTRNTESEEVAGLKRVRAAKIAKWNRQTDELAALPIVNPKGNPKEELAKGELQLMKSIEMLDTCDEIELALNRLEKAGGFYERGQAVLESNRNFRRSTKSLAMTVAELRQILKGK